MRQKVVRQWLFALWLTVGMAGNAWSQPSATPTATPALPKLTLRIRNAQIIEGGSTTATVSVLLAPSQAVMVQLRAYVFDNYRFQVRMPQAVVIPAGEKFVSFRVSVAQDELVNSNPIQITATAPGYEPDVLNVLGINDDRPRLKLSLDLTSIREDAAEGAIVATLSSNVGFFDLKRVTLSSSDPARVQVPSSIDFYPASSKTFLINVRPDAAFNAPQTITITASADGLDSATATLVLLDAQTPRLSLRVFPNVIEEVPLGPAAGTLSREGDVSQSISVALRSSDLTEVRVPTSVVFAAGQRSATFPIGTVDDRLIDFTQTATIMANPVGSAATQYASARVDVIVRDSNPLVSATISRTVFLENSAPDSATLTLKLSRPYSRDLFIPIGAGNGFSSGDSRIVAPRAVRIPAGSASATATVSIRNDDQINAFDAAPFTVFEAFQVLGARRPIAAALQLSIFDDDGELTLSLPRTQFDRSEGSGAARATVSRRVATAQPLIVDLSVTPIFGFEPTLLRAPAQVTIPANARSITFPIDVIGVPRLNLSSESNYLVASAVISGQRVQARVTLQVFSDQNPVVFLSVDSNVIGENGLRRAIATLRLQRLLNLTYTFTIRNSNPSRVRVPNTVVLPAGAMQVQFPIDAIDNTVNDGDQPVTITVSKPGFFLDPNTIGLTVIDDDGAA